MTVNEALVLVVGSPLLLAEIKEPVALLRSQRASVETLLLSAHLVCKRDILVVTAIRDGPNGCRGEGGGPGIAGSRLGWGENRREKQRCPGGTGCRAGKGRAAVWTSQAEVRKRHFGKQLESAVGR